MKPYVPTAPNPEAFTWRTLISSGITVVSLTAYGLIAGGILGADDPQVAAKLAGRGLNNFAVAAIFGGAGLIAWWAAAEQKLSFFRSLTAIAAVVFTITACIVFADGLFNGSRSVVSYLTNPALVHGS
ncbi:MAG: hypothetical protein K5831_14840 [Brevundimonas sp.]|uniref:hypothetical protein n=1 Tax=Brevundimonas sp. TaxID=1871086 RepID=UPI0025825DFB|nr:hypothetical protein [Brevundimonas sp.]MCV0416143.1 hypothetical protein [Brevundimonas sp.]